MQITRRTRRLSVENADLRLTLERLLSDAGGRPVSVAKVSRTPSPFATGSPVDILSVVLPRGHTMRLFVKHLGSEQAAHPDKQCRDREVRIYDQLLREPHLPVVRYYGSRSNAVTQQLDLFLEFVDDWNLTCHHVEHWITAARHLAKFHAHFARHRRKLVACDFLLRLDARYLRDWACRAVANVREHATPLAAELAEVVDAYGPVAELIALQPTTLVHNDLAPKNVLAHPAADGTRICFVDWEMAGLGCGLLDLVHLKHGLDPASDRAMCNAYCDELEDSGLLPSRPRLLRRLFAACSLHQTLFRLAHAHDWGVPLATAAQWVAEAREFLAAALDVPRRLLSARPRRSAP